MGVLRRIITVLGIAIAAAAVLRVKGKTEQATRRGGWRPMNSSRE
jgi:hypothetical protein